MHWKSNNIKFTSYNDANEVVDKLFNSFNSKYQDNLEKSKRESEFIFDSVQWMHYKSHTVNFRCGGSYIDSPGWIKKKKATINPKNKDDKCFQYVVMVALNYEEVKWNPKKVSNIKPFINKHKVKWINDPSKIDGDWKTFEKNNLTIDLNILFIIKKEIRPAYISKINWNCEKQILLLIISSEEKEDWHYLAVKKLSVLLRGKTSKHVVTFIAWITFILLEQKINLNRMKRYVKINILG